MATNQETRNSEANEARLNVIQEILCLRIDELLDALGVTLNRIGKMYAGPCPIHEGDNTTAISLYPEGRNLIGYWKCRTHNCHHTFKPTIVGFVRGVLSHKEGWSSPKDTTKIVHFQKAMNWICDFIGQKYHEIKADTADLEKRKFANQIESLTSSYIDTKRPGVPRNLVRKHLIIPAEYYIKRGYSAEILDSYDVGLCNNPQKEMYGRIVVPVYDENTGLMTGCVGRSLHPVCPDCKYYHMKGVNCPSTFEEKFNCSKWKNQHNFYTSTCLYNYWKARGAISRSGVIILVEGPGDVWRLEEAGIRNAVAIFGNELHDEQQIIIESSGAMSVVVLLDNDKAGKSGIEKIRKDLHRSYKLYFPSLQYKDIGETPIQKIQDEVVPLIRGISKIL